MRLLNRPLGRLSRYRRGPVAGLLVVLMGLLLTGGLYAAFTTGVRARGQLRGPDQAGSRAVPGRLLVLPRQQRPGRQDDRRQPDRPALVGVGAAAVDFQVGTGRMPATGGGPQVPQKEGVFKPDEIAALAAYVASLGPGPAIPNPSDYSLDGLSEEQRQEAIARGGQIFLTNCTACHNFEGSGGAMPRGGYAPKIRGVEPKYIFEAMLTGPQAMDNFSNGNLSVEEKRDIIAYLQSLQDNPDYGGFGMGGIGPVSEGMFAWIVGIGSLVGRAVWIAAHTARTSKEKADIVNDNLPETTHDGSRAGRDPGADSRPGSARPRVATDRRRPEGREARRAPGRRTVRPRRRRLDPVRRQLLRRSRSATTPTRSATSAPATSRSGSDPRAGAAGHGRRDDPVGSQADGRPRDRRDAPPGGVLAGGPRGGGRRSCRPGSRSRASAVVR